MFWGNYIDDNIKIIDYILINNKFYPMNANAIQYEIDELILSDSGNDEEIPFAFMDGIAVQVESIEHPIPAKSPVILIYPPKDDVKKNSKMQTEIANYIGHKWDGDFYSIALKYGQVNSLKHTK